MADPTTALTAAHRQFLAATFARNRERFGGWSMEADPAPADPAPSDPPPADPPADPKPDDGKGGKDAILADLAKERNKRQELEGKLTEFQTTQQQQMDAIAKALGLKSDDTPPDPAKLTEQVQAEQAKARQAAVQLAVYRNAGEHQANPDALLDSASFLASLAEIDPSDAAAVGGAIKAAVEKNAALKSTPATPSFQGGPRGGAAKPEPAPGVARLRQAYANPTK